MGPTLLASDVNWIAVPTVQASMTQAGIREAAGVSLTRVLAGPSPQACETPMEAVSIRKRRECTVPMMDIKAKAVTGIIFTVTLSQPNTTQ